MDIFYTLLNRIETYHDEVITIQTNLTAIPALAPENGGEGEAKKAKYIMLYANMMIPEIHNLAADSACLMPQ